MALLVAISLVLSGAAYNEERPGFGRPIVGESTTYSVLRQLYSNETWLDEAMYSKSPEEKKRRAEGYDTTYGEIVSESISQLSAHFKPADPPNSEFWDLGSGAGRVVIQQFLEGGWKRAVGVEIMRTRFDVSVTALADLSILYFSQTEKKIRQFLQQVFGGNARWTEEEANKDTGLGEKHCFGGDTAELCFINHDITKVPGLENAGGVFMCSTCFPNELLISLTSRFSKMKPGSVIMSLRELDVAEAEEELLEKGLQLQDQLPEEMSWIPSCNVSVYKRVSPGTPLLNEHVHVYTL